MAKASAAHSSPMSAVPPHFILDESTQFKLHRVGIALAGIGTLTAGQDQEQEDDQIEIPRSELSAIFDMVSDHLVALLNNLPYMYGGQGHVPPESFHHPVLRGARFSANMFSEDGPLDNASGSDGEGVKL